MAVDKDGNLIAGGDPKGYIYRISPEGKAFVLYDSGMREVHSVAVGAERNDLRRRDRVARAALPAGIRSPPQLQFGRPVSAGDVTVTIGSTSAEPAQRGRSRRIRRCRVGDTPRPQTRRSAAPMPTRRASILEDPSGRRRQHHLAFARRNGVFASAARRTSCCFRRGRRAGSIRCRRPAERHAAAGIDGRADDAADRRSAIVSMRRPRTSESCSA